MSSAFHLKSSDVDPLTFTNRTRLSEQSFKVQEGTNYVQTLSTKLTRDAKLVLTTHAARSSRRCDFRPSIELGTRVPKCRKTSASSGLFKFQIFSDKLTALTLVLGFLGFCVPLPSASHALQINQLYIDLPGTFL